MKVNVAPEQERPKLTVSRETILQMTPEPGEIGFRCSTINFEEMTKVFQAAVSKSQLEVL